MEITLEEIQKKFEGLPEDLKWAIMAANVDDNIIDIGKEQSLNVEQMGQLSLETHMVMFGFTHPDKFEESVKGSLQLPEDKTRIIVSAVNERILRGIREKMMAMSNPQPAQPAESIEGNAQILKSAGIEIVDKSKPAVEPNKKEASPILIQKLSTPFSSPLVKTEHSLENITKTAPPPAAAPAYPPKRDPYRLPPE